MHGEIFLLDFVKVWYHRNICKRGGGRGESNDCTLEKLSVVKSVGTGAVHVGGWGLMDERTERSLVCDEKAAAQSRNS